MKLLVTGFGPFPRVPRNPSGVLALRVAASPRWRIAGMTAQARVLTTAYAALRTELEPALAAGSDAVLLLGVAPRSKNVRVEWRATGRRSTLFADVEGDLPRAARDIDAAACRTRVSPIGPLRALRAKALPSRMSRDPGRYLCNAAYFRALAEKKPVLFIHIPMPPQEDRPRRQRSRRERRGYDERLTAALVEIGRLLLRQARTEAARSTASFNKASRSHPA